jgi:hypothetical protein
MSVYGHLGKKIRTNNFYTKIKHVTKSGLVPTSCTAFCFQSLSGLLTPHFAVYLSFFFLECRSLLCSWNLGVSCGYSRNPRSLYSPPASASSHASDLRMSWWTTYRKKTPSSMVFLSLVAEPLVPAQDVPSQVKREEALCVRGQRGMEERAIPTESITGEWAK